MENKPDRRTYISWVSMLNRCKEKYHDRVFYYDRGIKACARWQKFENFLADMGKRPENKTLDRIDNDKGYGPSNCKWSTLQEQNLNRRIPSNKTSTYRWVHKCKRTGMFVGSYVYNKICYRVGMFEIEEHAYLITATHRDLLINE